jgi:NAD-reducing hydrogenase large subunit
MSRIINIDPVTRIEGHARISIHLDEAGHVNDAQLHVTQLRGFEKLAQGRPFREMPALTARICGICPVSHLLASAKACDKLLGVTIPPTAVMLRRLLNYAQMVQSHALSFFYLSAPDMLLGMDAPVAERNIAGLLQSAPELARQGVHLRQFGQTLIEGLGGKRIHNAWVVGGGVSEPMQRAIQSATLVQIPDMIAIVQGTLKKFKAILPNFTAEIQTFANFPTLYMGLLAPNNTLEYYDGQLRLVNADGQIVRDIEGKRYAESIGEEAESFSYLKSPYYIPMGYPDGIYRVGALARLHVAKSCGTPLADAELEVFRQLTSDEQHSSFFYHYARLIEMLHGLERIEELLRDPDILSLDVRVRANPVNPEGIGIIEAPRGTLIHHYKIDEDGLITDMNLIVSTGHNVLAMNRGIKQAAQHFVRADKLEEGMLNRVEAVIRAFDPCLSCASHAVGQMPLHIQLLAPDGKLLEELWR